MAGKATLARGEVLWPDSADPVEQHADDLVRVVEAGLARDRVPAPLPTQLGPSRAGGVSPLDADPARQASVLARLEAALHRLSPPVCSGQASPVARGR
jgi:hypothetical protein